MSLKATKYILSPMLLASSFLVCLPAMAQQLNRTGGNRPGGNCLCLKAVKDGVAASWFVTRDLVDDLNETQASEIVKCAENGGVFMGGTTCMSVASLRSPKGPTGAQGPAGQDGEIKWQYLSASRGEGGGGGRGSEGRGGFGVDVDRDGIGDYGSYSEARAAGHGTTHTVDNCNSCGSGPSGGGGGDDGGGGGKVICGELYRQGYIPRKVYVADMRYHRERARPEAIRAYHFWGVPYVKLMQRSRLATALIRPLGTMWAHQMAYEMGAIEKPPLFGAFVTRTITGLHNAAGALFFGGKGRRQTCFVSLQRGAIDCLPRDFFRIV